MKFSNQNGLTHIAIAVVVVVLAVVSSIGYFVFAKNNSKNPQSSSSTTSSNSTASNVTTDENAVKAAAKAHFSLVYQKKAQEAYQLTCQEFQDLTPYSTFQAKLSQGGFYAIDLSAIEYTSVDVRNNQAKMSGPVGPLQPGTNLEVSLLKKNSQWCIVGYEAN